MQAIGHSGLGVSSPFISKSSSLEKHQSKDPNLMLALLATAQVRLRVGPFTTKPIRAMCDTGSQVNLLAEKIMQTELLPTKQCNIRIVGVNSVSKRPFTKKVCCQLLSRFNENPIAEIELLVVTELSINSLPNTSAPIDLAPAATRNELADPLFNVPAPVNMLLGAGVWAAIMKDVTPIGHFGIVAQNTRLGWLLFGGGVWRLDEAQVCSTLEHKPENEEQLATLLRRFWEVEEIPTQRIRTAEQEECEQFFKDHHFRTTEGRYVTGIPIRSDVIELGSSREAALRRFHALERRFEREPELREKYVAGMNEMLEAGHLQEADHEPGRWHFYLPHHPVTRKFRIVFDPSCKTNLGISLNEAQMIGEKLQDDLFDLIMRFRTHRIGITADIRKMYLQVGIIEQQWDLQRTIWRADAQADVKEYWLTRVTFGMSSAPHCAVRAMIQCARDQKNEYPQAARAIESDFYMDDCLTGADSEEEARILCTEMTTVLANGGFPLSKWHSNGINAVPAQIMQSTEAVELGEFNETTVLGLRWLPATDELTFNFRPQSPGEKQKMTMRYILSQIAQLFDPNGYLGPAIVAAKIIMQNLWKLRIGWDVQVPQEIAQNWLELQAQLPALTHIRIPRWVGTAPTSSFSLHGFADASELAYGAVVYVRVDQANDTRCVLFASRSRVAPVKTVTIPRLELCAAVLLSELMQTIRKACDFQYIRTVLWTDSSIVLHWMGKDAAILKPFVHNRIQTIRKSATDCEWRHVSTADNPADVLSRGVAPAELESLKFWWNGPAWLVKCGTEWPSPRAELSVQIEKEVHAEIKSNWLELAKSRKLRPIQRAFTNVVTLEMRGEENLSHVKTDVLTRTSSWRRLIRRTAWLLRFLDNCQLRGEKRCRRETGDVTEAEEERAIIFWVKQEQSVYYGPELMALQEERAFPVKSQLIRLNPVIDENGILRVGGRLENAALSTDQKHPMILHDFSHLAHLLIRNAHQETLHGRFQVMAAALRQRFWITNLRRAIRTQISRCIPCVRQKQKVCEQIMGNLPADRVRQSPPFSHSGVDYAGPFEVKARSGRCRIVEKKYVAVFVCMSTKAVHLELVEDLSTAAFIAAFLRFTGIRGSCTHLWSDNGTCFVGAEKELAKMVNSWSKIDSDAYKEMRELKVKWHFITPSAPHQGGLWESAVKAMKHHLRRVVGQQKLTSTDLHTLLAQISAVLNSRPLTALTDDPDDLNFLSPGHLINGRPLKQLFGERIDETPKNALRRYEITQHMSQSFWKQWHQIYLNELQQRPKWQIARDNLKVGNLVLIKDENAAPTFWATGRVTQTFPGTDGFVRNVELRVAGKNRKIMRPVQKLVLLPLDQVEESVDSSRGECAKTAATAMTKRHTHTAECGEARRWCDMVYDYVCDVGDVERND